MLLTTSEGLGPSCQLWGAGESSWGGCELKSSDSMAEVPAHCSLAYRREGQHRPESEAVYGFVCVCV